MKRSVFLFCLLFCFTFASRAQITCDPNGNLVMFTNYDGGILNINVDVNIPNIKIGICSYEAVTINLSGTYVGNVTAVRYAGYNSANNTACSQSVPTTTINGAPGSATTSITFAPPVTVSNSNGYSSVICAYSCSLTSNQGGCNTLDQVEAYFQSQFTGSTIRMHKVQYGCWLGTTTQSISTGGTCCLTVAPPTPFSVAMSMTQPTCNGGCNGTATATATGGTPPYTYQWTGGPATATWTNRCAGTYTMIAHDASTGTSTQTITVTQPAQKGSTVTTSACKSLFFNNATITTSGTYKDTLTALNGCDSIITLNLTINNANVNVSQVSNVLTAAATGATYQWVNCDSNKKPITGATGQVYTATANGHYAVIVTAGNGCKDTSACKTVTGLGIEENRMNSFSVYPNPAGDDITIEIGAALINHKFNMTDQVGKTLLKGNLNGTKNTLSIKQLPAGMYMLHVEGMKDAVKVEKY
jgi:hypothetical protein